MPGRSCTSKGLAGVQGYAALDRGAGWAAGLSATVLWLTFKRQVLRPHWICSRSRVP
jgi:hypothetical protein